MASNVYVAPDSGGSVKKKKKPPKGRATPQPHVAPRVHQPTLEELAAKQARQAITEANQPLLDQQKRQQEQDARDQAALRGISLATAEYLKGAAPGAQDAYSRAGEEIGSLSRGASDAAAAAQAEGEARTRAAAVALGGVAPAALAGPLGDTTFLQGGNIPGTSIAERGAAAGAYASALPGISMVGSEAQMRALIQNERDNNQKIEDALSETAAKYPSLRDEALTKLQAVQAQREQVLWQRQQQLAALRLQAQRLGLDTRKLDAAIQQNNAELQIAQKKLGIEQQRANISQQNADANTKRATIAGQKAAQSGKSGGLTAGQVTTQYTMGLNRLGTFADKSRGKPTPYTGRKGFNGVTGSGKYVADPRAKGTIPGDPAAGIPRTTNNPRLAKNSSPYKSFAQAAAQAWVIMGGDSLVKIGIPASDIRKAIRQALVAAGWKPDGKRPAKKKPATKT